ncbi:MULTISPECIES: DUF4129 domain-containing protein [unclassified Streptomyces]|uniref:DUF4129 domain-containing protein n=1 Tax=unclassified Streptomyces TaxID=2593676 RepID=UPI0035D5AB7F
MEHGEHERRRAVPGAVVAAGVVGALAVAALVLRPAEGLLHSGQGPLGHWGIVAIGSSVAWAVGVMLGVERLRPRIAAERDPLTPGEERLRRPAVPLLLAGPGVIGVLALVMHRFNHRSTSPAPPVDLPPPVSPPPVIGRTDPEGGSGHGYSLPLYVLLGLLAAVVVVVVTVVVVRRLRRRGLTVPALPERAGAPAEDEDARLLLSAVHSGRRALADTGDARTAVIACYAAMEDALVASGVRRHASDSPADLLTRAADAGLAPGPAAPRLTTLFREARYSSHPMGPSHREAAAGALEEIASLLQEREAQR